MGAERQQGNNTAEEEMEEIDGDTAPPSAEDLVMEQELRSFLVGSFKPGVVRLCALLIDAFGILAPHSTSRHFVFPVSPGGKKLMMPPATPSPPQAQPLAAQQGMASQQATLSKDIPPPGLPTPPPAPTAPLSTRTASSSSMKFVRVFEQLRSGSPARYHPESSSGAISPAMRSAQLAQGIHRLDSQKLRGSLQVECGKVVGGELEVRLQKARNPLFRTTITKPIVLDQLLYALRAVQSALLELHPWKTLLSEGSTTAWKHTDLPNSPEDPTIEDQLLQLAADLQKADLTLAAVIKQVREAIRALEVPNSGTLFPSSICFQLETNPPLPSDTVLDFSVQRGHLAVNAYAISETNLKGAVKQQSDLTTGKLVGTSVLYRDAIVDVLEHGRATSSIPEVDIALNSLTSVMQEIGELKASSSPLLKTIK